MKGNKRNIFVLISGVVTTIAAFMPVCLPDADQQFHTISNQYHCSFCKLMSKASPTSHQDLFVWELHFFILQLHV